MWMFQEAFKGPLNSPIKRLCMWKTELQPERFGLDHCMSHATVVQQGKGKIKAVNECIGGLKLWNSLYFYAQMLIRLWTTAKKHWYKVSEPYWSTMFSRTQKQAGGNQSYGNAGHCANTEALPWIFHEKKRRHSRWRKNEIIAQKQKQWER